MFTARLGFSQILGILATPKTIIFCVTVKFQITQIHITLLQLGCLTVLNLMLKLFITMYMKSYMGVVRPCYIIRCFYDW